MWCNIKYHFPLSLNSTSWCIMHNFDLLCSVQSCISVTGYWIDTTITCILYSFHLLCLVRSCTQLLYKKCTPCNWSLSIVVIRVTNRSRRGCSSWSNKRRTNWGQTTVNEVALTLYRDKLGTKYFTQTDQQSNI